MNKKRWMVPLLAALAAAALAAALWWNGAFLPGWVRWDRFERLPAAELADGLTLTLSDRRLTVDRGGEALWRTPRAWKISGALTGDVNHDGAAELLLLVWKRGSYGPARPSWIKWDPPVFSQHIYIYQWKNDAPVPIWMSSAMRPLAADWSLRDDGVLSVTHPDGQSSLWGWQGWGLSRLDGALRPLG